MSRSTGTAHPGAPVLHCYIHTVGENEIASSNRLASAMISTAALARAMIASLRASCVRRPSMDPLFGLKRGLIVVVVLTTSDLILSKSVDLTRHSVRVA